MNTTLRRPAPGGMVTPSGLVVPKFDYRNKRYLDNEKVTIKTGLELEALCKRDYGIFDSRAVTRYMRANGITLEKVFEAHNYDYSQFGGMMLREVLANDSLNPFFGPAVQDGLKLGLETIVGEWEAMIGTTVPLDRTATQNYLLTGATTAEDYTLKEIGQGSEIPVATITVGSQLISITKKGRGIEWVDEVLDAPVALAQLWLQVLGVRIGQSYSYLVTNRLLYGYLADGSDDAQVINTATTGVLTLRDLMKAKQQSITNGFPATDLVVSPATWLDLQVMQMPTSGDLIFPDGDASIQAKLGVTVHQNEACPDDLLVFVNKDNALVRWVNKPFSTEDDRTPSRQVSATYATTTDQITIGEPTARVVLDKAW